MRDIDNELNEMWREMTGTEQKRLGIAGVIIAATIWHHQPSDDAESLLHAAVVLFEQAQIAADEQ